MNKNYLIIGQPRTGTDSIIKMLENYHGVKNYTLYNKKFGIKKWLSTDHTVAKMHTIREYNQFKTNLKQIIKRTKCVYYTTVREDLTEHFISLLSTCVTRNDEHNILGKIVFPVKNQRCYILVDTFMKEYKRLNQCIDTYKTYPWKKVKFVNVFKGFKYMENKYTKNSSKKFFENTEEIKDYINEKLRRNKL